MEIILLTVIVLIAVSGTAAIWSEWERTRARKDRQKRLSYFTRISK